jgi:hypothetical protein
MNLFDGGWMPLMLRQKDAVLSPHSSVVNHVGHVHAVLKCICRIVCMVIAAEVGMSRVLGYDVLF